MARADAPIKYMDRTRRYYRALGYTKDYIWATFDEVPFSQLAKPLSEVRIALQARQILTASSGFGQARFRHLHPNCSPTMWPGTKNQPHERPRSFLPIEAAAELGSERLFAGLTARFHGVPTEYSQRKTLTEDAPEILSRVHEDGADAALLCPLWPVCHQTVSW
jgi:hypothetical protein